MASSKAQPPAGTTAAVLAFVFGALVAVAALTKHWVVTVGGDRTVRIGLLDDGAPTAFIELFGYLTVAGAIATVICCITAGALILSGHASRIPVRAIQALFAGFGLLGALYVARVMTYVEGISLWPGWSALLALAGTIGAGITLQSLIAPVDGRKVGAVTALLSISGLVTALFLWMVGPAAAREVKAACNGMAPSWSNPAFEKIPVEAPDFELQDIDGKTVKLSDYRGKIVLVNFWASWCDVCKSEKKSLARITRDLQGDDFVVLTIASDTDLVKVDESMRAALSGADGQPSKKKWGGAPFRILVDPPDQGNLGTVAHAWGLEKVPETFLIDREGNIRMYLVNKRNWGSGVVETCVQSLIDE